MTPQPLAGAWRVFPCRPNSKLPATEHGFKDAVPAEDAEWRSWPDTTNLAVATGAESGVIVIDLDGPTGYESWRRFQQTYGPTPPTLWTSTPNVGWHVWFQHPGREIRNSAGKLADGIDVRGDGGYVLIPPSAIDGRPYRWRSSREPAAIPTWLYDLLCRRPEPAGGTWRPPPDADHADAYLDAALRNAAGRVRGAGLHTRNETLNRESYGLGRLPVDETLAKETLLRAAIDVGLTDFESRKTIKSGFGSGRLQPRNVS